MGIGEDKRNPAQWQGWLKRVSYPSPRSGELLGESPTIEYQQQLSDPSVLESQQLAYG